jgi:hypothetical protein
MFGRPSGLFIRGDKVYVIDSESGPYNQPNWRDGVRIGPVDEDRVTSFIPPSERDDRVYQGTRQGLCDRLGVRPVQPAELA